MDELKPCPFCGGQAQVYMNKHSRFIVKCMTPGCIKSNPARLTKREIAAAWNVRPTSATESYEGLLLICLMASVKKVKAGLEYAGSGEYQDYPPGIIELGVALDGIDMIAADMLNFVKLNTSDPHPRRT